MSMITYEDGEKFASIKEQGKAYPDGEYDFTFDDRFVIYHYACGSELRYVVLDTNTDYGSEVKCVSKENKAEKDDYENMLHDVLRALKYTGIAKYYVH